MTSTLTFLPWLRRGLVAGLSTADSGQITFDRSPQLDVYVDVNEERVEGAVRLRPADHVTGIDLTQVARRYPSPGSRNVETGYWPLIELASADLPWAMTPLVPGGPHERLRPWLVLVCFPRDQVTFSPADNRDPASITVDASLLPSIGYAHLWGHVQSNVDAASTPAAADGGGVLSRLIAPVDLEQRTTYRVALVPLFVAADDLEFTTSWDDTTTGPVTLQAFDTWTFTTGIASTFEAAVELLEPVDPELDMDLGIRSVDVTDLGGIDPWPDEDEVLVDYAGPLVDTDLNPVGLEELHDPYRDELIPLLDEGDHRTVLDDDDEDPVVTPPMYGAYAARDHIVPASGWRRWVNVTLRQRMAAGLGADLVREHQERYMTQAWRQAGQVLEARRALNAARLQAEIGRTLKSRADRLDNGQHVGIFRAQYTTVRDDENVAARGALNWSGIPNGLFDPVFNRVLRSGSTVGRAIARRTPTATGDQKPRPMPTMGSRLASIHGDPAARAQMRFGVVDAPVGARMAGSREQNPADATGDDNPWRDTAASRFGPENPDTVGLGTVAANGRQSFDPMGATRARMDGRIGGLADHMTARGFPNDEVPVRFAIGPRIDEALMWTLIERSPELLMPGLGEFPDNSVRIVETNASFVASFLAGANHEMSRELLWREYPADMGSTTFHRFWDRPDDFADVDDMSEWGDASLTAVASDPTILGAAGEAVVLLAKGDVFRLYPNLIILLKDPTGDLAPPEFGGTLPGGTRFFAFDVPSVDDVIGGGWWVRFQEQPTEPRFGEDEDVTLELDNAATYAATAYQKPFAYEFPAERLAGEGDQ